MRKIILCAIFAVALVMGVLFFVALQKHNAKTTKIEKLPACSLVTIEAEEFSLATLKPERKTAIMFFSTDCEFCRKEIEGVIANRDLFNGIVWVFVTLSPREELDLFLSKYPLYLIPDAKVCVEEWPEVFLTFDVVAPPSIFIYDRDGNLEHYKHGAVSINTIMEWFR